VSLIDSRSVGRDGEAPSRDPVGEHHARGKLRRVSGGRRRPVRIEDSGQVLHGCAPSPPDLRRRFREAADIAECEGLHFAKYR
jgi:hypothetical protein